jgi:hypothetical protein
MITGFGAVRSGSARRIRLVAYGARLESVLGESPRGFESPILRQYRLRDDSGRCRVDRTAARASVRVRVVPKRSLLRDGALSYVLATVPVFVALYLLAGPERTRTVVVLQVITALVYAVPVVLYSRVFIEIGPDSITEQPFLGRLHSHPLRTVAVVAVADTYRESSSEIVSQLFVGGAEGARIVRMRATYWEQSDIDRVMRAVGDERLEMPDPVSVVELFERYPGSRYWFESSPVVSLVTVVVVAAIGAASIVELMTVGGIPRAGL